MRKRILFVDDDPTLLQFYRVIMQSEKDLWEVSTIGEGKAALELLDRESFDVLVSDLRMPGMNGFELMRQVSQRHPEVARITVSGLEDQEELARCLGATHQFLPKPFDFKSFKSALARVGSLDAFLADPHLQKVVSKLGSLPSFPSLYTEIMAEIRREESSLDRLAEIVVRDPGMTAKLLQIVNSATFARKQKVTTPLEAIQFLGAVTVQSLALSVHIFSSFEHGRLDGISPQKLWEHTIRTATLARSILQFEREAPDICAAAYTAGLLHDIGKLILLHSLPEEYQTVLQCTRSGSSSIFEAETRVFGASHAGAGAYLLGLWGLPAPIVEAVAFHHEPSRTALRSVTPLTAVHVANALVNSDHGKGGSSANLDCDYLSCLGVLNQLEQWQTLNHNETKASSRR